MGKVPRRWPITGLGKDASMGRIVSWNKVVMGGGVVGGGRGKEGG